MLQIFIVTSSFSAVSLNGVGGQVIDSWSELEASIRMAAVLAFSLPSTFIICALVVYNPIHTYNPYI